MTEQLARVVQLWRELLSLIRSGTYTLPGQRPCAMYCTNSIDVRLLDALDTLHALDEASTLLAADYTTLFTVSYTDVECRCQTCVPTTQLMRFLTCKAVIYHLGLDAKLLKRVFDEVGIWDLRVRGLEGACS